MSMLELTREELNRVNALTPTLNAHIQRIVNAIPYDNVPERMKAVIAVSHLISFASQFRRNVVLWDGTPVPINAITFCIAGSGVGKDSGHNAAKRCFAPGYDLIESTRKQLVIDAAISEAKANGDEPADEFEVFKSYMKPIPPIHIRPTTGPGLIQHINDIAALDLSATCLYTGEFSDELAYNPDMMEDIKILAELFDLGVTDTKYTKSNEFRSKEINGQPASALFIGSPGHILYDESTKRKFYVAFMSKLARRSWFFYTPDTITPPSFDSLDDFYAYEEALEEAAAKARESLNADIRRITVHNLQYRLVDIPVSDEVTRMFKTYKRYNTDLVDYSYNPDSTSALIRKHLQWKALKLAGAFAIMDCSHVIELHHYVDAIRFCELLDNDMQLFETQLNKADHERFSDYIRTLVTPEGFATVSVHDLKKNGFISSVSPNKLRELVTLCTGYDNSGYYTIVNDGGAIRYEPIIKADTFSVSYKPVNMAGVNAAISAGDSVALRKAKESLGASVAYGFETVQVSFEQLQDLLSDDFAYSPFVFKDGVRGRNSIIGGTNWLVFDVDASPITYEEAHFMLSDINHYVALSSDPTNFHKFRVILQLDSIVDLPAITWKHFYQLVAQELALPIDVLPQSQIFFAYANRPILATLDASPLEVHSFVVRAIELADRKESTSPKSLTPALAKAQLSDPLETFSYAFNAPMGAGSRNIYRMILHAKDLGASPERLCELIDEVNDYWEFPMEQDRVEKLKQQARFT